MIADRSTRALAALSLALWSWACTDSSRSASSDTPWSTAIDSTGDTIAVRITGEVPERLVRTLVPELRIGSADGSDETTFGNILAVRPTHDGGVLVYDQQVPAVRLFDAQGAFARNLSVKGGGPGEFGHLNGVVSLSDGRWVVWDAAGLRLNFHGRDGAFVRSTSLTVGRTFGQGMLFVDGADRLHLDAIVWRDTSDFSQSKRGLIVVDTLGAVLDTVRYPEWGDPPNLVKAATPDGGSMTTWYVPFTPSSMTALLRSGGIVTGPSDPYRLYLMAADSARPVRIEREHAAVPVAEAERSYWTTLIETAMRRVEPAWRWNGPGIPERKPAYRDIEVGLDGRIWVQLSAPAEPIPEAELPPLAVDAAPSSRSTTRTRSIYDVYSPTGALLGRVMLPWRTSISATRADTVWGTMTDSLDVPYAVRFRMVPALPADR